MKQKKIHFVRDYIYDSADQSTRILIEITTHFSSFKLSMIALKPSVKFICLSFFYNLDIFYYNNSTIINKTAFHSHCTVANNISSDV